MITVGWAKKAKEKQKKKKQANKQTNEQTNKARPGRETIQEQT